jgi:hypothetical protein
VAVVFTTELRFKPGGFYTPQWNILVCFGCRGGCTCLLPEPSIKLEKNRGQNIDIVYNRTPPEFFGAANHRSRQFHC